ncbi:MAG: TldD/PmbA family protein, partial [Bacteroidales bacterium]|nr:TldD/PmbA family protein [Bacteroidales bacterium]
MEGMNGALRMDEIRLAEKSLETALRLGANKARVTLNKSLMELYGTLNGELDKVNHCLDRSMSVCLFVDGRFGSFSTNRLDESELETFLAKSISTVRMLAEDPCRDLP